MRNRREETALELGSEIIQFLIPHRPPFLLVDGTRALRVSGKPGLRAYKAIGSGEPIFQGHFPDMHLWPGVYTIEGMGQTCNVLYSLLAAQEVGAEAGFDTLEGLRNLQRGFRMHTGYDPSRATQFRAAMDGRGPVQGVSAAVDVKLLRPVFAGETLEYDVTLAHVVGEMGRFEVSASVDGKAVARGTLTSHRGPAEVP